MTLSTTARIERVTLRPGTRYVEMDGRQSVPRILDHAAEVTVISLALNPGEAGVYKLANGTIIHVRFEDEVRG